MFQFFFSGPPAQQTAKTLAKTGLITGLLLIGFGMLVFILRDLFALLAAAVFFVAGFSAIGYAVRMFIVFWRLKKTQEHQPYRDNVEIRIDRD